MDLKISDKVVFVNAASRGIGRAAAELFLKEGCKVAIASSDQTKLYATAVELKKSTGTEPEWVVCDLNKPGDIENAVKAVSSILGDIDILVNNCGGPVSGKFDELNDNDWTDAVDQVLMSAIRMTREVLPGMKAKNWGRIINITSISVKQPIDNLLLSNSLRSAVTAWAKSLSGDLGEYNITVNNVAPGYTLTSRLYELAVARAKESGDSHEHVLASMAANVPLKRLARPDEIASMIVFLSSEPAAYVTGQTIVVDGGLTKSTY
ncbi:MAG: SDR family oxidoreductase [Melioribacteraceae bacterium]|nr:SDR family oxidoreductase [Melioribacteraceae bacterium]